MVSCCRSLEPAVRTIEGIINYTASCKIVKGAYNLSARIFTFTKSSATTLIGKVITPLIARCHKNKRALLQRKDYVGTVAKTVKAALKTIPQIPGAFVKELKFNRAYEDKAIWAIFMGIIEGMGLLFLAAIPTKGAERVGAILGSIFMYVSASVFESDIKSNSRPILVKITNVYLRIVFQWVSFTLLVGAAPSLDLLSCGLGLAIAATTNFCTGYYDLSATGQKLKKVFKANLETVNRYKLKIAVLQELRNLNTSMDQGQRAFDDESCAIVSSYIA